MTRRVPVQGDRSDDSSWVARYAVGAGMGVGPAWVGAALLAGLMRRGYSFAAQPISDLGIGPHAWVLNTSLILTGSLAVVFGLGFARFAPRWRRRPVAAGLLATFGIGFAAAGVFHEPLPNGPITIGGILHFGLGFFVAMIALVVALFMIGSALRTEPAWKLHAAFTRAVAWLVIVLMVLTQLFFNPGSPLFELGIGGLMEWALFLTWSSWFMVSGHALFRHADRRARRSDTQPRDQDDREISRPRKSA
jgi:hypothetical membrane protein